MKSRQADAIKHSRGGARRRGFGYAAVLAVCMLVTVVGLAALLAARIELRGSQLNAEALQADTAARAGLELMVYRLSQKETWRTAYTHNAWTADEAYLGYTASFKLVDTTDANLADDVFDPVRVWARCVLGSATRMYSVLLVPDSSIDLNLLSNNDMENGTTGWTNFGTGTLSTPNSNPHGGKFNLRNSGTLLSATGIYQDVTAKIKNNTTYFAEVWARGELLSSTKTLRLVVQTTAGTYNYAFSSTWGDASWHVMNGTFQTAWSGDLVSAHWGVQASLLSLLSGDLHLDDARFVRGSTSGGAPALRVQRGSIRREVSP